MEYFVENKFINVLLSNNEPYYSIYMIPGGWNSFVQLVRYTLYSMMHIWDKDVHLHLRQKGVLWQKFDYKMHILRHHPFQKVHHNTSKKLVPYQLCLFLLNTITTHSCFFLEISNYSIRNLHSLSCEFLITIVQVSGSFASQDPFSPDLPVVQSCARNCSYNNTESW